MEAYIEKLNQLIAIKKNKGNKITKKEREEFLSAWGELIVAENGFSETVERYFYEGFVFAGAKPFVQWVLLSEDKFSAINSLFKGHFFGKDTPTSFRVLVSTLAQLIISNPTEKNLICPVIENIPSVSKTKENKTLVDGHKVILKYFISELNSSSLFPVLSELNIKPTVIRSFVEVFEVMINRLDLTSLSTKDAQKVVAINKWLHPDNEVEKAEKAELIVSQDSQNVVKERSEEVLNQVEQNPPRHFYNPYDQLISMLNETISLSRGLRDESKSTEKKCTVLQEAVSNFQREIEVLNNQLKTSKQREASLEKQLIDRGTQISGLSLQVKSLEDEIQKLTEVLEAKDQEIDQRTQMMDALSRDRTKQADEQMHRLASDLKVEYRDFHDAETLTMDCDLGENMREQLKNVFSILSKVGISLD
ncbi:MAG: hypothetical protein IKT09_02635 [Synergistes sp.]|nr:hypothetical protein [Synergistes sp.]